MNPMIPGPNAAAPKAQRHEGPIKQIPGVILGLMISLLGCALLSCSDEKPMEKPAVVHENSYEIDVASAQLSDGRVVITTTRDFYVSAKIFKHDITVDTLPSLGTETVHIDGDDNGGDGKDTTIAKQYDVYTILR